MLVELSVVEQRYHAVLEVLVSRVPVSEVADRYGVSRKSVHAWVRRYEEFGLGRAGRSVAPAAFPAAAGVGCGGGGDLPAAHCASDVGTASDQVRAGPGG